MKGVTEEWTSVSRGIIPRGADGRRICRWDGRQAPKIAACVNLREAGGYRHPRGEWFSRIASGRATMFLRQGWSNAGLGELHGRDAAALLGLGRHV